MSATTQAAARHNTTHRPTIAQRHQQLQAAFEQALAQARFWHVLPEGETNAAKATVLYDTQTGLAYPPLATLEAFLSQHPFAYLRAAGQANNLATLDSATRLLWNNETSPMDLLIAFSQEATKHGFLSARQPISTSRLTSAQKIVSEGQWAGLNGWELPSKDQLYKFATAGNNPHRTGDRYWLATNSGDESCHWMTNSGAYDTNGEK